uniref:hypothetical protein n=1 Tax=Methylobacterium sp. B34 TaxID=95563 RepID=UPI0005B2BDD5|nr:hypothetical protein [Methylobacterium sp. B34]
MHVPRGRHRTPRPAVLFHGTSTKWLDQILHNGLEPCHMTVTVLMGCYTDDRGIAIHHAVEMAEFEEAGPVLFRLPISCFDVVRFTLDDKFVELHPSAGRGVHAAATIGEEASENAPWTWLAMLRIAGSVGYTGTIPVGRCDIVQGVAWPAVGATGDSGF